MAEIVFDHDAHKGFFNSHNLSNFARLLTSLEKRYPDSIRVTVVVELFGGLDHEECRYPPELEDQCDALVNEIGMIAEPLLREGLYRSQTQH